MKDVSTVGGLANFPVENISHKPKRMQGDSIKQKFEEEIEAPSPATVRGRNDRSTPLGVITLERAIPFYEDLAVKDPVNAKLFVATSKWLKELLVTRSTKIEAAVKADLTKKEENSNDLSEA